jgi:DNA-binding transcriptional regulator YdaS (Cro superfamily)
MRDPLPASGNKNQPRHALLDALIEQLRLENDLALARALKVAPYIITMMREGRLTVSASMLLWIHDATGIALQRLRQLAEDAPSRRST